MNPTLAARRARWLLALLLLLQSAAVATSEETGSIEGAVKLPAETELANVVIHLSGVSGSYTPPDLPAEMSQRGLSFIPRVLPIMKGTTVNFLNLDPLLHDVFSPDRCAEKLNLGTWPKDVVRSYTFGSPGCQAVLLCNIHPGMEAWVLVFEHPFFTKPADDGSYRITQIPPGTYTLKGWHRKMRAEEKKVSIEKGKTLKVDITF